MGFDADDDSALKKGQKKFTLQQLQQDPNLLRAFADQEAKKGKTDRASLKSKMSLKQLQEKVGKDAGNQKDKKAMDIKTKMTDEQMQKQNKEKAQADKEQGQTEKGGQQV